MQETTYQTNMKTINKWFDIWKKKGKIKCFDLPNCIATNIKSSATIRWSKCYNIKPKSKLQTNLSKKKYKTIGHSLGRGAFPT